jgi:hypothetical protein
MIANAQEAIAGQIDTAGMTHPCVVFNARPAIAVSSSK